MMELYKNMVSLTQRIDYMDSEGESGCKIMEVLTFGKETSLKVEPSTFADLILKMDKRVLCVMSQLIRVNIK